MLQKNFLTMFLVGLIIIEEILPLLCDDFLFFSCLTLLSIHVPLEKGLCMSSLLPLYYSQFAIEKENFKQKMGFIINLFFFSLYVLNSYLLFIDDQPVFCTF
jgi:hypothetical protein